MNDDDRFLRKRAGRKTWVYSRAVPLDVRDVDVRSPTVTKSTGVSSITEAREVRDVFARADDDFWKALRDGMSATTARETYDAATAIAKLKPATVLTAKTAGDMLSDPEQASAAGKVLLEAIASVTRNAFKGIPEGFNNETDAQAWLDIKKSRQPRTDRQTKAIDTIVAGRLGLADRPKMNVEESMDFWVDRIIRSDWENKSKEQLRNWRNPIDRAVKNWGNQVSGTEPFLETTRQQVLTYFDWLDGNVSDGSLATKTANRYLGVLRRCWGDLARRHGLETSNPFRDLSWKNKKAKRPAFSVEWIRTHFLQGGLDRLNPEARAVVQVMIETGMRPSEIVNLQTDNIYLEANIPHVHIKSMEGFDIKTAGSERKIPLVGIALEAMRKRPDGFPKYRDKNNALSAVVNKYWKQNGLRETDKHTLYCIRHTFEDRMKAAGLDYEMRKELMGHSDDRADYGVGFSLEAKAEALMKMQLSFEI